MVVVGTLAIIYNNEKMSLLQNHSSVHYLKKEIWIIFDLVKIVQNSQELCLEDIAYSPVWIRKGCGSLFPELLVGSIFVGFKEVHYSVLPLLSTLWSNKLNHFSQGNYFLSLCQTMRVLDMPCVWEMHFESEIDVFQLFVRCHSLFRPYSSILSGAPAAGGNWHSIACYREDARWWGRGNWTIYSVFIEYTLFQFSQRSCSAISVVTSIKIKSKQCNENVIKGNIV